MKNSSTKWTLKQANRECVEYNQNKAETKALDLQKEELERFKLYFEELMVLMTELCLFHRDVIETPKSPSLSKISYLCSQSQNILNRFDKEQTTSLNYTDYMNSPSADQLRKKAHSLQMTPNFTQEIGKIKICGFD